jgi:hypothetical protein
VVAKHFNAVQTLQAVRRISTLMAFDADLADVASLCGSTTPLAARVETLFANLRGPVAASIKAGFHAKGQRKAAVRLYRLLPAVVAISASNTAIATELRMDAAALVITAGAGAPLGKLPKLR